MSEIHRKLGSLLKLERERQKVELAKISEELKISEENLEKVEEGDSKSLPSELYFNLFARSYAEILGIDFTATVEAIREDLGELPDISADDQGAESAESSGKEVRTDADAGDKSDGSTDSPPRFFKKALNFFLLICGAFAVIFAVQIFFFDNEGTDLDTPADTSTPAVAGDLEAESETASDLKDFNWDVPERSAPSPLALKILARQESWATILSDGDTAVFRNLVPWREYNLEADYRFVISIAHPSVVDIHLNGRKVDIRNAESRRISRVRINQVNYSDFPDASSEVPRTSRPAPAEEPAESTSSTAQVYGPLIDTDTPDSGVVAADSTEPDTTVPNEEA